MSVIKLQAKAAGQAAPDGADARLRGEKLAQLSVEEEAKWPFGVRVLIVLVLGTLAWLAVLLLPGLLNDLVGFLIGALAQALS